MKVHVKVTLSSDAGEDFMGLGLVHLLRGIETKCSIYAAAERMSLSYVKALRILNRLEKQTGHKVVERHKGGVTRGGAELTEFGRILLEEFELLQGAVLDFGDRAFEQFEERLDKRCHDIPEEMI